jgi:anti-sigma factor RsiW
MMTNCLDAGTIQAFLDGELAPAAVSGVSAHIAGCDACAAQLATAEEESSFVFSVLEREMDTLVPTQRLWGKINDSIEVERQNAPIWHKAWSIITASLASPSIAVAAVAVVMLGIFATVFVEKAPIENSPAPIAPTAAARRPASVVDETQVASTSPASTPGGAAISETAKSVDRPAYTAASYTPSPKRAVYSDIDRRPSQPVVTNAAYIPGEESYVKTIATLNKSVDGQKDQVFRASERVSFERDMAVVNDAIDKMRVEVRKNPKNESAKQVLYTSYQNKIDLLNSVSQREELVALR